MFPIRAVGIATAIAAAASTTLITATTAHADVGTVDVRFLSPSGTPTGEILDTFANLFAPQCDNNTVPSGTAKARITNNTDQTITAATGSCGNGSGNQSVPPGRSVTMFLQQIPVINVVALAGL